MTSEKYSRWILIAPNNPQNVFLQQPIRVSKIAFCSCFAFSDLAGQSGQRFTATEKSIGWNFSTFTCFILQSTCLCVKKKIVAAQFLTTFASIILRFFPNVLLTINKLPFVLPYNTCFEVHSKFRWRHTFGRTKRTLPNSTIIISHKRTLQ